VSSYKDETIPTILERLAAPWITLLAAFQFLTIFPPLIQRPFTPRHLGGSVAFFPLVGAVLGMLLATADGLSAFLFPPAVRSAIILAMWVLLTGSLHLDGFLDTCDGLLGGATAEKRLEIMRDERVGAYALAGGTLLLLLKFSALQSLPHHWGALVLATTLGRWGMSLAVVAYPYARSEGLGRIMKDQAGWLHAGIATLITLVVVWLAGQLAGLAIMALAGGVLWLGARFTMRRIPGLTGDVYGALNETIELVTLMAMVAITYISA
jgi:adenosylcobinamide-GDP ribazoletransferase